jgi:replicative superfamily II helicase
VYIAPMKALAQEVVEKFDSKLRGLGLVVRELTGDMQLSRAEAAAADVLVTVRGALERYIANRFVLISHFIRLPCAFLAICRRRRSGM